MGDRVHSGHTCHAHGCDTRVPAKLFMCRGHWFSLPKPIQRAIWREYRRGQERDKTPSAAYMAVQQYAVSVVAFKPNDEGAAQVAAGYLQRAYRFQAIAIEQTGRDPLRGLRQETT